MDISHSCEMKITFSFLTFDFPKRTKKIFFCGDICRICYRFFNVLIQLYQIAADASAVFIQQSHLVPNKLTNMRGRSYKCISQF